MFKNFFAAASVCYWRGAPETILTLIAYRGFEVDKPRGASNDMPNRRYLAWRLIDPAAEAKLFVFRTSNLPPSKEGGEGDCGHAI